MAGTQWDWASSSPCTFAGVVCGCAEPGDSQQQRVTQIDIDSFNVAGTLSPSIGDLTMLTTLSVGSNIDLVRFPVAAFRRLPHLSHLSIDAALLVDAPDAEWDPPATVFPSGMALMVASGFPSGLPDPGFRERVIGRVASLTSIVELATTDEVGPLGEFIRQIKPLVNLRRLWLSTAGATGTIPDDLRALPLTHLTMTANRLSGSLGRMPDTLEHLDVSYCGLHVDLTNVTAATMPNMSYLDVGGQPFSGVVDFAAMAPWRHVQRLALESVNGIVYGVHGGPSVHRAVASMPMHEAISGVIAAEWADTLEFLDLGGLGWPAPGSLPSSVGQLHRLSYLGLDGAGAVVGGSLPASLAQLSALTLLSVRYANLTGSLFDIPEGHMPVLDSVYVAYNHLSGTVPASWGGLPVVNEISIHANDFRAADNPVPPELLNAPNLFELSVDTDVLVHADTAAAASTNVFGLYVYGSRATPALPARVAAFVGLGNIILYGVAGELPSFTGMFGLQAITMATGDPSSEQWQPTGKLTGQFPTSLFALPTLSEIKFETDVWSHDGCSTPLEEVLHAASRSPGLDVLTAPGMWRAPQMLPAGVVPGNATELDLPSCGITGSVPQSLLSWRAGSNVDSLDLRNNLLSQSMDGFVVDQPNLLSLQLDNNTGLHGSLPTFKGLRVVVDPTTAPDVTVTLSNCSFSGDLHAGFGGVTTLDVSNNPLRGRIHASFGQDSGFSLVNAARCQLQGELPRGLCVAAHSGQLVSLDLSSNRLTGPVLRCLLEAESMTQLSLRDNRLTVSLEANWSRAVAMQTLFLDSNLPLAGEATIPEALAQVHGLVNLDLSNLGLKGTIPRFSSSGTLHYVNLAGGQLTGGLHGLFGQPYMEIVAVSGNRLSGELGNVSSLPSLRVLDASHNFFSGPLPDLRAAVMPRLRTVRLDSNLFSGALTADFLQPVLQSPVVSAATFVMTDMSLRLLDVPPSSPVVEASLCRLSGSLPSELADVPLPGARDGVAAPTLSVLEGNLFACSSLTGELFQGDVGRHSFVCRETSFPWVVAAAIATFICGAATHCGRFGREAWPCGRALCACVSRRSAGEGRAAVAHARGMESLSPALRLEDAVYTHFARACRAAVSVVAIVAVCALAPAYAIAPSHFDFRYGMTYSAAFIQEGVATWQAVLTAAVCVVVVAPLVLTLQAAHHQWRLKILGRADSRANGIDSSDSSTSSNSSAARGNDGAGCCARLRARASSVCMSPLRLVVIGGGLVACVVPNAAYVSLENTSASSSVKLAAAVLVVVFKLVLNTVLLPLVAEFAAGSFGQDVDDDDAVERGSRSIVEGIEAGADLSSSQATSSLANTRQRQYRRRRAATRVRLMVTLTLVNSVAVPVVATLLFRPQCLLYALLADEPKSSIELPMTVCPLYVSDVRGKQTCALFNNVIVQRTVSYTHAWDRTCPSEVISLYGAVFIYYLAVQGLLYSGAQLMTMSPATQAAVTACGRTRCCARAGCCARRTCGCRGLRRYFTRATSPTYYFGSLDRRYAQLVSMVGITVALGPYDARIAATGAVAVVAHCAADVALRRRGCEVAEAIAASSTAAALGRTRSRSDAHPCDTPAAEWDRRRLRTQLRHMRGLGVEGVPAASFVSIVALQALMLVFMQGLGGFVLFGTDVVGFDVLGRAELAAFAVGAAMISQALLASVPSAWTNACARSRFGGCCVRLLGGPSGAASYYGGGANIAAKKLNGSAPSSSLRLRALSTGRDATEVATRTDAPPSGESEALTTSLLGDGSSRMLHRSDDTEDGGSGYLVA